MSFVLRQAQDEEARDEGSRVMKAHIQGFSMRRNECIPHGVARAEWRAKTPGNITGKHGHVSVRRWNCGGSIPVSAA